MKFTAFYIAVCACLLLVCGTVWAAPKILNDCKTITDPGSYILKKSLTVSGDCFVIQSNVGNITFDDVLINCHMVEAIHYMPI